MSRRNAPLTETGRLRRYHCHRLAHPDRAAKVPVRRCERDRPGELIHVDVKKLGNIPDGGGHRTAGRQQGLKNKLATTSVRKNNHPVLGYSYLHSALDDHSRLVCTEILADERKDTATAFLHRAHARFASHGITIERILSGNGACYRSLPWAAACAQLGITRKRTRPCRPQTNGKIERYHRTLAGEWACAEPYATETARRNALPDWPRTYNNHRGHTALGGRPPASRVTNLSGQNT